MLDPQRIHSQIGWIVHNSSRISKVFQRMTPSKAKRYPDLVVKHVMCTWQYLFTVFISVFNWTLFYIYYAIRYKKPKKKQSFRKLLAEAKLCDCGSVSPLWHAVRRHVSSRRSRGHGNGKLQCDRFYSWIKTSVLLLIQHPSARALKTRWRHWQEMFECARPRNCCMWDAAAAASGRCS